MIQVIHRALSILEVIASSPKEDLSLSEIADSLQLNHGTCANILKNIGKQKLCRTDRRKEGIQTRLYGLSINQLIYLLC